jgi:hypothetical protein
MAVLSLNGRGPTNRLNNQKGSVPLLVPPKKRMPCFEGELGTIPAGTSDSYRGRPSLLIWIPPALKSQPSLGRQMRIPS